MSVTPTAIKAQVPWEVNDTTSINAYVRSVMGDGSILSTTPVAVTIVAANPGVFTLAPPDIRRRRWLWPCTAQAMQLGIVDIEGSITANDVATVTIQDRSYSYTIQASDTTATVRDNLAALVNQDPVVSAEASGEFTRIILKARVEGPAGNDIPYGATNGAAATIIATPFSPSLCCASVADTPITPDNPAIPGEFIVVYATGLGVPILDDNNSGLIQTGVQFPQNGPITVPTSDNFVSSLVGGSTADVISATLLPGSVGIFKVILHLNASIVTNPTTALTIAQGNFVSKVVTIPVVSPSTPQ